MNQSWKYFSCCVKNRSSGFEYLCSTAGGSDILQYQYFTTLISEALNSFTCTYGSIWSLALSCCRQVHPELVGVPAGSQRQHEELHVRRQQQRHDELTFHARQSRPAAAGIPPASPPPHWARMPWDHFHLLLLLLPLPPPPPDTASTGSLTTPSDLGPCPPPSSHPFDINIYKYTQIYFKRRPPLIGGGGRGEYVTSWRFESFVHREGIVLQFGRSSRGGGWSGGREREGGRRWESGTPMPVQRRTNPLLACLV